MRHLPNPTEVVRIGAYSAVTEKALRDEYSRAYRSAWERYVAANDCTPAGNDDDEWLHEQAQAARDRMRGLLI
jgi:hypothetical protein